MSKILVVDDDANMRGELARLLRQTGHVTDEAGNVAEAFAALAAHDYAGVILDLSLGGGVDPEPLREALSARGVPVLLVSGVEPSRLPEVATPRGWPYMAKPWEPDALLDRVDRMVRARATDATGARSAIVQGADGSMRVTKGVAQIVSETTIDAMVAATLAAELLYVRPASEWIQGGCVVGLLLLAGVRVADLVALSRGLPSRGGPGAVVLATLAPLAAAASRLGDRS